MLLGGERILVFGGMRDTGEVLQLPREDNYRGPWTLIPQSNRPGVFGLAFLVNFNDRILVISKPPCIFPLTLFDRSFEALQRIDNYVYRTTYRK